MEKEKIEPTYVEKNKDLVFAVPKFQLYLLEPPICIKINN